MTDDQDDITKQLMLRLDANIYPVPEMTCPDCDGYGTCRHCQSTGTNPTFVSFVHQQLKYMGVV